MNLHGLEFPYDPACEAEVLSGIVTGWANHAPVVDLSPSSFFHPRHHRIFRAFTVAGFAYLVHAHELEDTLLDEIGTPHWNGDLDTLERLLERRGIATYRDVRRLLDLEQRRDAISQADEAFRAAATGWQEAA